MNSWNEIEEPAINSLPRLYDELILLITKAKHYAIAHKCICNSLGQEIGRISRESESVPENYWQANRNIIEGNEQILCNRRKLSNVFDEILELSLKIENLVSGSDAKPKEVLLCRNIRCAANIFVQDVASRISEESYFLLRQSRNIRVAENRVAVASPPRLPFLFSGTTTGSGVNSRRTFLDNLFYLFSCVGQGAMPL